MNLVDVVAQDYASESVKALPEFRTGDTLNVHVRIKEGNKTRIQQFKGICIATKQEGSLEGHFRVRKIGAGGVGVERVFPYHCPSVEKVEVVEHGKSRRAKHFYLRDRKGKSARLSIDYDRANKSRKEEKEKAKKA